MVPVPTGPGAPKDQGGQARPRLAPPWEHGAAHAGLVHARDGQQPVVLHAQGYGLGLALST
ncbi:hypothetical protein PIB30_116191, partial [Stylosanthes scabra]|nr:hypothetical protein [Stylosanthes scabra]